MTVFDSEATRQSRRPPVSLRDAADAAGLTAPRVVLAPCDVRVDAFGELAAISRLGGQGRVYSPARVPFGLGPGPVVVKLYRRPAPAAAAEVLAAMVAWRHSLEAGQRARLERVTAWPLSVVTDGGVPVGIAMQDVSARFSVPFVMPSGRSEHVLLALEHLLGGDDYLELRGLSMRLDTAARAHVAERISGAVAFLHRHAVVASDIAPSNLLVSLRDGAAGVCLIDCDSMVFRGRQALASVETGDWNIPAGFGEAPRTRATDAYKLGLVVLRLFARSHDARTVAPHLMRIPMELRDLLHRALAPEPANRPAAGEWQRALSQLSAEGHLNERYPGPVGPPRPAPAASPRPAPVGARLGTTVGSAAAGRLTSSARLARAPGASPALAPTTTSRPQPVALRSAVIVLWLVTLAVITALLVSRLLAAAAPQGGAGFGSGAPKVAPQRGPYFQYYGAPSGAQRIPYVPYQ